MNYFFNFCFKKIKKYIFILRGQVPWTLGYEEHKYDSIKQAISDSKILNEFQNKNLSNKFGYRLDERIVEYPWILNNLKKVKTIFLDAGSTFNFDFLLENEIFKDKYIYIFILFFQKR